MSSAPGESGDTNTRGPRRYFRSRRNISGQREAGSLAAAHIKPRRTHEATPVVSSEAPTPVADPTPAVSRPESPSYKANFSTIRFVDFVENGQISKEQLKNIPFEFATEVQAKTLGHILAGKDVLARAKTGTGKTLAFLIPAIETLRRIERKSEPGKASVLVISPTRELAQQIGDEAKSLVKGMPYGVQVITGGGPKLTSESNRLLKNRMDILVATPGRLVDHIQNASMRSQLSQIRFLILDEADRLLDQGFRRDLETILEALPDRNSVPRQALLFSATVSEEIGTLALLPEYEYISTVSDTESSTHEHVNQEYIIVENDTDIMPIVAKLIEERKKVMCFLPTARATGLMAEVMTNVLNCPVYTIHSRLSQPRRTKATENFKREPTGVLFSSDVTARGIDIPGVTCVIQVGLPPSSEQYIHRLGRTARAGNEGHGILVLSSWEEFFLRKKDVIAAGLNDNLVVHPESKDLNYTGPGSPLNDMRDKVRAALAKTDDKTKEQAYVAWMGYYKTSLRDLGWTELELVRRANEMARFVFMYGADSGANTWTPPPIFAKTIGMMGLRAAKSAGLLNVMPDIRGGHGEARNQERRQEREERGQGRDQDQGPGGVSAPAGSVNPRRRRQ